MPLLSPKGIGSAWIVQIYTKRLPEFGGPSLFNITTSVLKELSLLMRERRRTIHMESGQDQKGNPDGHGITRCCTGNYHAEQHPHHGSSCLLTPLLHAISDSSKKVTSHWMNHVNDTLEGANKIMDLHGPFYTCQPYLCLHICSILPYSKMLSKGCSCCSTCCSSWQSRQIGVIISAM